MKHPLGTKAARKALADALVKVFAKHVIAATVEPEGHNFTLRAELDDGVRVLSWIDTVHDDCILLHWSSCKDLPVEVFGGRKHHKATSQFGYDEAPARLDELLTRYFDART